MPYLQAIHRFWRTILVEVFLMSKSSGKTQPAPSPIPSPRLCPCFPAFNPPKTQTPTPSPPKFVKKSKVESA